MRLTRPLHLGLAGGLAVALVGAPAGAGFAAYRQDVATRGVLPAGARIGEVDVTGMTRTAALAAVQAAYASADAQPAVLRVGDREFTITPAELGVHHQVSEAVDAAFAASHRGNWLTRAWHKVRHHVDPPRVEVPVTEPGEAAMTRFVTDMIEAVGVTAQDATARVVDGFLYVGRATPGVTVDQAAALAALRRSLADGMPQDLATRQVTPAVPDTAFGTVLLVRTGENKIYLYKNGKVERTYGVATGSPKYPTPLGRFKVVLKRYRPTWVNPWSKWSMHEPAFIKPGPRNPLGTRAMNLSAPGIRIHGTPAAKSIGYSVSHGCIRMRMSDVEALYELVPSGTTVFIVRGGPPRFPGQAAPPPATPADAADGG